MATQEGDCKYGGSSVTQAIRAHIYLNGGKFFFYRKLDGDAGRVNITLHSFAVPVMNSVLAWMNFRLSDDFSQNCLIQRGGRGIPADIPAPSMHFPDDPVDPVIPIYEALQFEKETFEDVLRLCTVASKYRDYALEGAIEGRPLKRESKDIKDMGDFLQPCVRASKQVGHGVYHLDRELRDCDGSMPWAKYNIPDKSNCLLEEVDQELKEACWGSGGPRNVHYDGK